MATKLLTMSASSKEAEALINALVDSGTAVEKIPIESSTPDYDLSGSVTIDRRQARAKYRNGAIEYGPVETTLKIDDFRVRINWHKALNIPTQACIVIKDPCGNTIFKECWKFNLGVSEFVLLNDAPPIKNRTDLVVLDVGFRDPGAGKEFFDLTGKIPLAGQLLELFVEGFVAGAIVTVGNLVEKLLRTVLGSGELAKLFIKLIKEVFKIVTLAVNFIGDMCRLALQPLDEMLHKLFGDKLEIVLKKEAFPKNLVIIRKTDTRPEVTVRLTTPPLIDVKASGLHIEVIQ